MKLLKQKGVTLYCTVALCTVEDEVASSPCVKHPFWMLENPAAD